MLYDITIQQHQHRDRQIKNREIKTHSAASITPLSTVCAADRVEAGHAGAVVFWIAVNPTSCWLPKHFYGTPSVYNQHREARILGRGTEDEP
jgi:hypothetical protein